MSMFRRGIGSSDAGVAWAAAAADASAVPGDDLLVLCSHARKFRAASFRSSGSLSAEWACSFALISFAKMYFSMFANSHSEKGTGSKLT